MGLDSRSRPSVLWMKSIPVRVEGPALTSGQSPTYYEYNNGLTGIIEHLRSSRSIALLYPLCWFMTPCDGEEDSSGTRVPCATQWGKKSESLPFSFFPPCVARSPTSPRRAIGSRAIDFVLASAGARREGSTFFSTSETSMPTVDRESLSRARETRLYLGTREPLEPSPLSSPFASVTGRERKRAGRAPSTRNISTRGENVRIFLSFESYIEGIEEDRSICASGNLTRSIHALIRTIIGITELSWIYRGLIVAPSRIRRTETWKGRNDTRTRSSIILESEFSRNFGIWDIFRKILLTSPRLKTCYVRLENERKRFGIVINYRYERGISNRKVKSSRAFRMERCGTAIFSKSGNRFCKAVYKQFPWKRNKSFCHRSDCWSANRQMAMEARGKYFPSCFRGELNRNKVTIASPVVNTDLSLFNTIRDIAIVWHPRRLCDFPIKMFIGRETFFFCRIRVVFSIVEGFANDTFFQMME